MGWKRGVLGMDEEEERGGNDLHERRRGGWEGMNG